MTFALSDAAGTDDYLAASAGCEALVAAELVAYALGRPPSEPEERLATLADELAGLREHATLAVRAVAIVADADHSELTDLWTEDGPNAGWDAVLIDLKGRLDGAG